MLCRSYDAIRMLPLRDVIGAEAVKDLASEIPDLTAGQPLQHITSLKTTNLHRHIVAGLKDIYKDLLPHVDIFYTLVNTTAMLSYFDWCDAGCSSHLADAPNTEWSLCKGNGSVYVSWEKSYDVDDGHGGRRMARAMPQFCINTLVRGQLVGMTEDSTGNNKTAKNLMLCCVCCGVCAGS